MCGFAGASVMKCLLDNAGDFFKRGVAAKGGEDTFLFEGEHAVGDGGAFDCVGVDIGDVAADEGLDVFGDDKLFHDDEATVVTEGMILCGDWVVESDVVEIEF